MVLRLSIVSLGKVPRGVLEGAGASIASTFGVEVHQDPPLAEPEYAFNPSRGQHHAAAILRKLARSHLGKDRELILGVGALHLFDPDGEELVVDGDRDVRAAVVGLNRIRSTDETRYLLRVSRAGVVAVGLALGLRTCDDGRCGMAAIVSPESLEKRGQSLCLVCSSNLAKGERAWAKS